MLATEDSLCVKDCLLLVRDNASIGSPCDQCRRKSDYSNIVAGGLGKRKVRLSANEQIQMNSELHRFAQALPRNFPGFEDAMIHYTSPWGRQQ